MVLLHKKTKTAAAPTTEKKTKKAKETQEHIAPEVIADMPPHESDANDEKVYFMALGGHCSMSDGSSFSISCTHVVTKQLGAAAKKRSSTTETQVVRVPPPEFP